MCLLLKIVISNIILSLWHDGVSILARFENFKFLIKFVTKGLNKYFMSIFNGKMTFKLEVFSKLFI